ncbi:hypothetical protein CAEBREN_30727 [Caenorhabditis brenneri]|uniref:Serpentine Receptor, class H n=1 Tax=Caenorhabditis brenneri TaxID=135651 RepID=G0MU73_CAEBE|nr:hypothetical protein CAEBREN_30727 [Caenorhabditis brenneri]
MNSTNCISNFGYFDSPEFLLFALHANTGISTPIHFLGMACLLSKTPEQMKSVKGYLVNLQLWIIIFDYSLSIFLVPYIMYPALGGISFGIFNYFHVPCEAQALAVLLMLACEFLIIFFSLCQKISDVLTSILAVFENRFYTVCMKQNKFWRSFRHLWIGGHYTVVTIAYSSFLLFVPNQEGMKEKVFQVLPCLPSYLYNAPIYILATDYTYHFIVCIFLGNFYCFEGFFFVGFIVWHTVKQLRTKRMSRRTFQMQKNTFIALVIQLTLPLVMLILPCVYSWASLVFVYYNQALMNIAVVVGSLHGAFSTLVMVSVHRPYREAITSLCYKREQRVEQTGFYQRKDLFVVINY